MRLNDTQRTLYTVYATEGWWAGNEVEIHQAG